MHLITRATVAALLLGSVGLVGLSSDAGAAGGLVFYVNAALPGMSVSDCTTPSNTDCGLDNAIDAFNADTTPDDADGIVFGSSISTYVSTGVVIDNTTTGVSLTIFGNGPGTTAITGDLSNSVFRIQGNAVNISNVTVEDGSAPTGGGIDNEDGSLNVSNDVFTNEQVTYGGGIFNDNGTVIAQDDVFTNNSGAPSEGDGIFSLGGDVSAIDDTFANNVATNGSGGGILFDGDELFLVSDTFSNDSATGGGGGGALFAAGTVTATNDTFVDDSAGVQGGGAINLFAGTLGATDDTFFNDSASDGDGITNQFGTVAVSNSILDGAPCAGAGVIDGGYNVESDDSCGFGSTDVVNSASIDLAATLSPNGSTISPETLAIGPGSSALLEVPSADCSVHNDERVEPRPGYLGQGACDAGAFEYQHAAPPIVHKSQTIDFAALPPVVLTATSVNLSASATSGLTVAFASTTPSVCTVTGSTVSLITPGLCSIAASQPGDAQYLPAPSVTESFSVTAPLVRPGRPRITARSPFKGRIRISLTSPSSGATGYQYSLGAAWKNLPGDGPFVLSGIARSLTTVRVRGVDGAGDGPSSPVLRVHVRH